MDRAYEGKATRELAESLGYRPVVPPKSNRRSVGLRQGAVQEAERGRAFFCRYKRFRRTCTRYDKLDRMFAMFIHIGLIHDALR